MCFFIFNYFFSVFQCDEDVNFPVCNEQHEGDKSHFKMKTREYDKIILPSGNTLQNFINIIHKFYYIQLIAPCYLLINLRAMFVYDPLN